MKRNRILIGGVLAGSCLAMLTYLYKVGRTDTRRPSIENVEGSGQGIEIDPSQSDEIRQQSSVQAPGVERTKVVEDEPVDDRTAIVRPHRTPSEWERASMEKFGESVEVFNEYVEAQGLRTPAPLLDSIDKFMLPLPAEGYNTTEMARKIYLACGLNPDTRAEPAGDDPLLVQVEAHLVGAVTGLRAILEQANQRFPAGVGISPYKDIAPLSRYTGLQRHQAFFRAEAEKNLRDALAAIARAVQQEVGHTGTFDASTYLF